MIKIRSEILVDSYPGGNVAAVFRDGELYDLFIDITNVKGRYGPFAVIYARIQREIKSIGGYFITLPNKQVGFLASRKKYVSGQKVLVMVKGFTDFSKAEKFTDIIKVETEYAILIMGTKSKLTFSSKIKNTEFKHTVKKLIKNQSFFMTEPISIIVRSNLEKKNMDIIKSVFNQCERICKSITNSAKKEEIVLKSIGAKERAIFAYNRQNCKILESKDIFDLRGIWDKIWEHNKEKYFFNEDSYLIIQETASFIGIDVNSGNNFTTESKLINLAAVSEIIKLLRVRGLGGKIIIDFISCTTKCRSEILMQFRNQIVNEYTQYIIHGWTKGGLFEISVNKNKVPLKVLAAY